MSVLLAWLWKEHQFHVRVLRWQKKASIAVCPLTELGFLRISTQPAFGASMDQARKMLTQWHERVKPQYVFCDLRALETAPARSSGKTTDYYLASLATRHEMLWATLDQNSEHPAAFVLPEL